MSDTYLSFDQLVKNEKEGVDYSIVALGMGSSTVILAPHGGGIEPGTEEIALALHNDGEGLFIFSGTKKRGNEVLHITSRKYDHPLALELVKSADFALSLHGSSVKEPVTFIGGLHAKGKQVIGRLLEEAGFSICARPGAGMDGVSPSNIVNQCRAKGGVQLEISRGQRELFFECLSPRSSRRKKTIHFHQYVRAVRIGIDALTDDPIARLNS